MHEGVILCFTVLVGLVDSIQEQWLSSRGLDHVAVLCHSRRVNNPQIPRGASAFNPSPGFQVMGVTRFVWALLMIRAVHYSLVYYSWGCGACGCLFAVTVVDVLLSCARCGACWVVERRGSVEVLRARVVFQMRSVIRSAHSGRVMD